MPPREGASAPEPLAEYPLEGGRTIVLYESITPATDEMPAMRLLAYTLTRRNGWQWETLEGAGRGRSKQLDSNYFLDFSSDVNGGGRRTEVAEPITLVFGEAVHEAVASVKVTFGNSVVAQTPIRDGVFAIATPRETTICSVTALDTNGDVLREFDFVAPDLSCAASVETPP